MRLNSKGQVTIPAELRRAHNLREGDEVRVVDDGGVLRIERGRDEETRGQRAVRRLRGSGGRLGMTTDEIMELLRGEE